MHTVIIHLFCRSYTQTIRITVIIIIRTLFSEYICLILLTQVHSAKFTCLDYFTLKYLFYILLSIMQ